VCWSVGAEKRDELQANIYDGMMMMVVMQLALCVDIMGVD